MGGRLVNSAPQMGWGMLIKGQQPGGAVMGGWPAGPTLYWSGG